MGNGCSIYPLRPENWLDLHNEFLDWAERQSLSEIGGLRNVD